jgi:hypothetical protein
MKDTYIKKHIILVNGMFNFFFGILIYPVQEIHKHCPQEAWPEIKIKKKISQQHIRISKTK